MPTTTPDPRVARSRATSANAQPSLKLVGSSAETRVSPQLNESAAALTATDPRWVFAVRVSERLQGAVLTPERREALMRMGKVFGLTAFDCQLIIAIVQDQARRGHKPDYCPTAGAEQLRMIPVNEPRWLDKTRALRIAWAIAGIIGVELALVWWWLG